MKFQFGIKQFNNPVFVTDGNVILAGAKAKINDNDTIVDFVVLKGEPFEDMYKLFLKDGYHVQLWEEDEVSRTIYIESPEEQQ